MKQNYKIAEKKEIMKLNDKISYLSNEIEIKQSKIDYIDKRHKNLQLKYLKVLGDKRKMNQDNFPIFKYNKERDNDKFSEINSTRESKYMDSIKSYNSIKKTENNSIKKTINKNEINNSKSIKNSKDLHLPEIKNKNNKKSLSLQKKDNNNNNKQGRNNALKDLNMLLSDFSEKDGINNKIEEELEEDDDENEEDEKSNQNEDSQG